GVARAAEGPAPVPARLGDPAGLVDLAAAGPLGPADKTGGRGKARDLADGGLGAGDLQADIGVVAHQSAHGHEDEPGMGLVHIGSLDCAPDFESMALSDRESCTFVNNPAVELTKFSLTKNVVTVDLAQILKDLDFVAPTYDEAGEVTGSAPGVGCHSFPDDEATGDNDCGPVFDAFGLSPETGEANASKNAVFGAAEG
ncbi:MAG: hypothetical protein RL385_5667, partial [Pseudomonadota bacterium]